MRRTACAVRGTACAVRRAPCLSHGMRLEILLSLIDMAAVGAVDDCLVPS